MYDSLIKAILLETFLVIVLVRNIIRLKKAIFLRKDFKSGRTMKIRAKLTRVTATANRGSNAKAVYTINGSEINGTMVCACSWSLWHKRGEYIDIIVGKTDSTVFANDKEQIRDAVLTWAVFSVPAGLAVAFFAFSIAYTILRQV